MLAAPFSPRLMEFLPSYEFKEMRGPLRWRLQVPWLFLSGSVFRHSLGAQLTCRESLRDIEACLHSMSGKLYHMGFRSRVARSTLADADESHDWRIFADFAQVLIGIARPLYAHDPIGVDLDQACTPWTRPPSTFAWR